MANCKEPQTHQALSLMLLFCLFLFGCESEPRTRVNLSDTQTAEELSGGPETRPVYWFGFDPRRDIKEEYRQYSSLLNYLHQQTGDQFALRSAAQSSQVIDLLKNGELHFAAIGAGSYLVAQPYGVRMLVQGLNSAGSPEYRSAIVVRPDSPLKQITDLKGKHFAFGSYTSTQGHLIPRITLNQQGLKLEDLAGYDWCDSHYSCANAVISGEYDAGGIQDTLAEELQQEGLLRILHFSEYFPSSGVVAAPGVDPQVVQRVKQALIELDPEGKHAGHLYNWQTTEMPGGFLPAREQSYLNLARLAKQLGLSLMSDPR